MTRESVRFVGAAALSALVLATASVYPQTQVPAAPSATTAPEAVPPAPKPTAPVFPKPDPKNFTATSPTTETVNAFLQANWGYDPDRIWQVQAIQKTIADGVSKVTVFVGDKTGKQKPSVLQFLVLPDGKHIVTGTDVVSFGAHPFADLRAIMQERADGPYRGVSSKDLELVEFADLECPHCKDAQANMDKLVADFPNARIVTQLDPLVEIHPQSERATEYALCVNKLGSSADFFRFIADVFDAQDGLATADGATLTLNSAVTKVSLDPAKVSACAADSATIAQVKASEKLAEDVGINEVPTLVVNGRMIPANIPYDILKKVIEFQAKQDGVALAQ